MLLDMQNVRTASLAVRCKSCRSYESAILNHNLILLVTGWICCYLAATKLTDCDFNLVEVDASLELGVLVFPTCGCSNFHLAFVSLRQFIPYGC